MGHLEHLTLLERSGIPKADVLAAQRLVREHVRHYYQAITKKHNTEYQAVSLNIRYFGGTKSGDWRSVQINEWGKSSMETFWGSSDGMRKLYHIDLIGGATKI